MSKYDNAVDLSDLKFALEGFDARLSAIEAAQKKPDAPTPEQREPGWYWVKWQKHGDWIASNLGKSLMGHLVWWPIIGDERSPVLIGPRIPEPGE